ncbi:MAG TPA: pilus assembly protein PilP [Thermoanaerobaculia bacterium]|nr:pilus assembly protein PilP [Thermoanaerobaculia bacterium]
MIRQLRFVPAFAIVMIALVAIAQTPKPGAPPAGTATATSGTTSTTGTNVQQSLQEILEEPATGETYHYDPQGRRDPFRSLIGPAPKLQQGVRPPGPAGFLIDEMKLQGVIKTKQGPVGMINGPDNKGYLVHVGDKVLDGEVIRVTPSSVVFRQEVNDPTRIERYREVVKDLSPEPAKK